MTRREVWSIHHGMSLVTNLNLKWFADGERWHIRLANLDAISHLHASSASFVCIYGSVKSNTTPAILAKTKLAVSCARVAEQHYIATMLQQDVKQ